VIRVPERDRVMAHLKSAGIGCEIYYPRTLPQQECFAYLNAGRFPNSELAAEQSLAIPVYPELTREQIEQVVAEIRKALG
jgi:dTDP-4-amino-4,6-dideoxygalactose transaminase